MRKLGVFQDFSGLEEEPCALKNKQKNSSNENTGCMGTQCPPRGDGLRTRRTQGFGTEQVQYRKWSGIMNMIKRGELWAWGQRAEGEKIGFAIFSEGSK